MWYERFGCTEVTAGAWGRGIAVVLLLVSGGADARAATRVYPAPPGEAASGDFAVTVDGAASFVYPVNVAVRDPAGRARVVDDFAHHGTEHDVAAFTAFDLLDGSADVRVTCNVAIRSARLLPTSAGVTPIVDGKTVRFSIARPANLTLEINGEIVRSLHLFANPPETHAPAADDPNVVYFGPGVHEIDDFIDLGPGQTLYVAGGAVLRATQSRGEPIVRLHGAGAAVRGRGVIDAGRAAIHSRSVVFLEDAQDVTVQGVIVIDSPGWTMPVRRCDRVSIENVKIIGFRANSDGIDLCNSRDVTVRGCFLRTSDDLIVIKTDAGQGLAQRIDVRSCVLWNQFAHALSIGAELREDVSDVTFADCDVIHDVGREWTLRIYHCDDATIRDVRFADIRVEESTQLISLWIGTALWTRAPERGQIADVTFERITTLRGDATIALQGFDPAHAIERVRFDDIAIGGRPLTREAVRMNPFVRDVVVAP